MPNDSQEPVSAYNNTLTAVLDKHAPLMTRTIVQRPRVPWFSQEITEAKRQRRRAVKRWRKSRLTPILPFSKQNVIFITRLMNKARREFYRSFIDKYSGDQKKLLRASQRLLNRTIDDGLTPNLDSGTFSNDLGEHFVQKVDTIRTQLDTEQQTDLLPEDGTPPAVLDDIVLSVPTFMMLSV